MSAEDHALGGLIGEAHTEQPRVTEDGILTSDTVLPHLSLRHYVPTGASRLQVTPASLDEGHPVQPQHEHLLTEVEALIKR